jgi:sarcosine oxidase subunit gamma
MFDLSHQMALAGAKTGTFGASASHGDGLVLRAMPEGHVLLVLGAPSSGNLAPQLARLSDGNRHAVRAAGPGQWFVVGNEPLSANRIAAMELELGSRAVLVEQSHGRVRIHVSGACVETVLAKGSAVDFARAQYPVGQAVTTQFAHVSTHITRIDQTAFELLVPRTFADHVWNDLIEMGLEFGVTASQRGS